MSEWEFTPTDKSKMILRKTFNWGKSEGIRIKHNGIDISFVISDEDTKEDIEDVLRKTADRIMLGWKGVVFSKATSEFNKKNGEVIACKCFGNRSNLDQIHFL